MSIADYLQEIIPSIKFKLINTYILNDSMEDINNINNIDNIDNIINSKPFDQLLTDGIKQDYINNVILSHQTTFDAKLTFTIQKIKEITNKIKEFQPQSHSYLNYPLFKQNCNKLFELIFDNSSQDFVIGAYIEFFKHYSLSYQFFEEEMNTIIQNKIYLFKEEQKHIYNYFHENL